MYFFRTLLLVCLIAGTFGFRFGGQTGSVREKLCNNNCITTVRLRVGMWYFPSNPGCEWSRRRAMGISGWSSKRSGIQQIQAFCASCPDPTLCLPCDLRKQIDKAIICF